jgi:hypothetical protein
LVALRRLTLIAGEMSNTNKMPAHRGEYDASITMLAEKMHESIRSTKKNPALGFTDEDKSSSLEIRLADATQYLWKSISLTQWKRDLTNRATAIVIGIKHLQQYQPKMYSSGSIRTLREELTLVFESLPGLDPSPMFQWWDQPTYDAICVSDDQGENEVEGLEAAVAFRLRMNGYQEELQAVVDGISNHELSQTDLGLSKSIHQGLALITEVGNTSHSVPSILTILIGMAS